MPKRVTLELTLEQRQELVNCRDHHHLPYLRERAAALLLLADGLTLTHIAASRLLRPRDPDMVSSWLKRCQQEGLASRQNLWYLRSVTQLVSLRKEDAHNGFI